MKLTLGNLTQLKAQLLNESLRSDTQWDAQIELLGKGVAVQFEQRCNRRFARVVGDTYDFPAHFEHLVLPRYPVETITAVEMKTDYAASWSALTASTAIQTANLSAGLVWFEPALGLYRERGRVTYTGGYWVPDDDAQTPEDETDLPEGATAVPDDLRMAWVLQCKHVWGLSDPLGISAGQDKAGVSPEMMGLSQVALLPAVETILTKYIRYAAQ